MLGIFPRWILQRVAVSEQLYCSLSFSKILADEFRTWGLGLNYLVIYSVDIVARRVFGY